MPLSSVIKARRGMLAFSFVWTEQGSIHMQTILHMQIGNDFVNVPTRTYANSDYFKRSALLFWDTNPPPLSWKYWRSVALNPDGPRSDLYAESRASYKYWRKDAVGGGRPNATFEKWPTWAPHQISSPPVRIYPIWSE